MKKILSALSGVCLAAVSCLTFYSPVAVHADDSYTGSTAWQDWLSYWHSSLNVAIDDITGGTVDADDLYKVRALQYAYVSMLYQQAATAMVTPDNYIPAGTIEAGWYYRGGKAHSVAAFYYGQNGDAVNASGSRVVFASADDFTIAVDYTPAQNVSFPGFTTQNFYGYYYVATQTSEYVNTLTFTGTSCTGIMTNYDFVDSSLAYVSRIATYDSVITMEETTIPSSYYVTSGYYSEHPGRFIGGMLKDPNGQPISNTTQQFIRATVSNSFPDFVDALKDDLYTNFPTYIIDEIWIEPDTPIQPIYPTDFVTGIPKDWTVENPPLPTSPQIDIDVPDATLPDLSGLTEYTDGVGFWWALTGHIMDVFGIRTIVLLLIGIGVFAFVIYRLGAG